MLFDPVLQLGLFVQLLKRRNRRDVPVRVWRDRGEIGCFRGQPRRNDQGSLGEGPSSLQTLHPFPDVFDDIDDVAEVDDLGWSEIATGAVRWIPPPSFDAYQAEITNIVSEPAAEVENGCSRGDQSIRQCGLDRTRIVNARDSRLTPVVRENDVQVHAAVVRPTRSPMFRIEPPAAR